MREVVLSVVAAGVLLAGCGAAESSTPVASDGASGAPAALSDTPCPQGPPARGGLLGTEDIGQDGVVGTLRNGSDAPIFVRGLTDSVPCRLDPGQGVAFAGSDFPESIRERAGDGALPNWFPRGKDGHGGSSVFANFYGVDSAILVTPSSDRGAPGVAIAPLDPTMGRPWVWTVYRTESGATCPTAEGVLDTGGLSEGQEYVLAGPAPGEVVVKRLNDDKDAVRQWSGSSDSKVDDWARIDLTVKRIGSC